MIIVANKKTFNEKDFDGKVVYIGRGSVFGNPFIMKDETMEERLKVINEYEEMFYSDEGKEIRVACKNLVDKHDDICLMCWCYPLSCHGDILREYMEMINKEE